VRSSPPWRVGVVATSAARETVVERLVFGVARDLLMHVLDRRTVIGARIPAREQRLGQRTDSVMGLLLFLLFGFVIGLLARAIMPGDQKLGLLWTTLLGIAGSFLGGFLTSLVTHERVTDFNTAGVIGSLVGAVLLLAIYLAIVRRHHVGPGVAAH
jgi:uncharacterized membrane protein YeaQ/YmgE (transglycosylase-associated protein family)